MKKWIIAIAAISLSAPAFAEGFICRGIQQDITVKVFNHVQPVEGTRNAAVMVVSDPNISFGRKTIATFDSESLLSNSSADYLAKVDLRYRNSSRKGENIGGTKLGDLEYIDLNLDFSYSQPVPAGSELEGELILKKRSGEEIHVDMSCLRYLKG